MVDNVLDDLARQEEPWVLVHGGNHALNAMSERLGHRPRFVTSPSGFTSRVTDEETVKLIEMVYSGVINSEIVRGLQHRGVNAVGLTGLDGGLLRAERKAAIKFVENGHVFVLRNDFTGTVRSVNTVLLSSLLDAGYRPVVTLPALGENGEALNVDGDRATAAIAAALGCNDLFILSNVPGLLRDVEDPSSRIPRISRSALVAQKNEFARDRMKKKLLGAQEALEGGVRRVVLADANSPHPIEAARRGEGTVIE